MFVLNTPKTETLTFVGRWSCSMLPWERVHGKTIDEWHTDDIRVHTSDIRVHTCDILVTYEYIQVTYGWHMDDIRVYTSEIAHYRESSISIFQEFFASTEKISILGEK